MKGGIRIEIKIHPHYFYIGESPQTKQAYLEYEKIADQLILVHTEVLPSLQGQGVGALLVAFAVEYARQHELKVSPMCSYAAGQFAKHPEYNDVAFNQE